MLLQFRETMITGKILWQTCLDLSNLRWYRIETMRDLVIGGEGLCKQPYCVYPVV